MNEARIKFEQQKRMLQIYIHETNEDATAILKESKPLATQSKRCYDTVKIQFHDTDKHPVFIAQATD